MSEKKPHSFPTGAAKPKSTPALPIGKKGIKIVTPGNGEGPFTGFGTKVIDLETGNEIKNVREIHVHIVPDDVVSAELVMLPSEITIKGAKAQVLAEDTVNRSTMINFLKNNIYRFIKIKTEKSDGGYSERRVMLDLPSFLKEFDLIFPAQIKDISSLGDPWRRFARTQESKNDEPKLPSTKDCIKVITAGSTPNFEAARKADKS